VIVCPSLLSFLLLSPFLHISSPLLSLSLPSHLSFPLISSPPASCSYISRKRRVSLPF
jgi:hypothetical protein